MSRRTMSKPRRSNDSAAPAALPFWRQRWAVIASAAVLLLVLLVFLSGRSWPIVFDRVLADGFFLLLWLLAAAGVGSIVPLPRNSLRRITQIALGLGILGL